MQILFLDDSIQRKCSRDRVGRLVAVGGIMVDAAAVRKLERAIDEVCDAYGFPTGAPFKWSPKRDSWMRDKLVAERRDAFLDKILEVAAQNGASGQVIIADSDKRPATHHAQAPEMDVLVMALERFDKALQGDQLGMVIVARPGGGRKDEDAFLADCVEIVTAGTEYARFERIVTNVLTMPFPNSRLLQVADLVVSITTAMVAGHIEFAGKAFPSVKALLRSSGGRIGGVGVNIHPDLCYANLYHWLLGDSTFRRNNSGWLLRKRGHPFFSNAEVY